MKQHKSNINPLNIGMLRFIVLVLLLSLGSSLLHAQIERTKTWVFGEGVGLRFTKTGFDTFSVSPKLNHYEGNGIWNDKNGDLFLYSDNYRLFDKRDTQLNEGYDFGGAASSCQAVILTSLNDTIIHCFGTIPEDDRHGGYVYNRYNVAKDSWEIPSVKLQPRISECQAHVNHQNGKWQWVVAHSLTGNTLYSYLIKEDSLEGCPTISNAGPYYLDRYPGQGTMKFSADGRYLFFATWDLGYVVMCEFNNETGEIIELLRLNVGSRPSGIEIAEKELFVSFDDLRDGINLYSFDQINSNSIINSKQIIYDTASSGVIGHLQKSLDGKIYVALNGSKRLGVIKNKNSSFVYSHTDDLFKTKKCGDGFPNFNASFFHTPSLDFKYKHTCHTHQFKLNAIDTFTANSFTWNFTKGSTTETKMGKELNYTFLDTGQWKIQLIANNGGRIDTIEKVIEVFEINKVGFLGKDIYHSFNTPLNGTLDAPANQHCSHWWKLGDTTETLSSSYSYTDTGTYICKTTNKHFCNRWDTIQVKICDTGFSKITRIKDTLFPSQVLDSNIWYKDNIKLGEASRIDLNSQGNYFLIQVNGYGCKDTAKYDVKFLYASTKKLSNSNINIYPNPNNGEFTINGIKSASIIKIVDFQGKEIEYRRVKNLVHLNQISDGVYFLSVDGSAIKIIVQKKH